MPPTVSVERTFSELEVGDWGINVVQLQEALVAAGHVVMVDGDFGPQTQAAVMAFQSLSRSTGDRDRRSSDGDALRHLARLERRSLRRRPAWPGARPGSPPRTARPVDNSDYAGVS